MARTRKRALWQSVQGGYAKNGKARLDCYIRKAHALLFHYGRFIKNWHMDHGSISGRVGKALLRFRDDSTMN